MARNRLLVPRLRSLYPKCDTGRSAPGRGVSILDKNRHRHFRRCPGLHRRKWARAGTEIPQQELQPERCLADSGYTYHKSRPGIRPLPSLSRPAIPVEIRVLRSNGVGTSKGSSALMTPPPFACQSRRGPSPGRHPKSAGAASGNYSLAYLNSGKRTANRARTAADATSVLPRNHRSRP